MADNIEPQRKKMKKRQDKEARTTLEIQMQTEDQEWREDASEAGVGGLTIREAAKGALCSPLFQLMPDPLLVVSVYCYCRNGRDMN